MHHPSPGGSAVRSRHVSAQFRSPPCQPQNSAGCRPKKRRRRRFLWPKKIIQTKWFRNPVVACPSYSNWWSQAFDWNQHGKNTKAQQYFQKENTDCPQSSQEPPRATKSHQEPPRATKSHQAAVQFVFFWLHDYHYFNRCRPQNGHLSEVLLLH